MDISFIAGTCIQAAVQGENPPIRSRFQQLKPRSRGPSRDAAVTFLKTGSPEDEYFLVEFSAGPAVTEDLTTDISRLQNHLIFAQAKGMTSLFDAVYLGL